MTTIPYKAPPMEHQRRAMRRAYPNRAFGLFHEMGTGKTFSTINMAGARYIKDQIEALVIIAPTAIKAVWEDELEKWCPVPYAHRLVVAGQASKKSLDKFITSDVGKLKVVIVGVEAVSQGSKLVRGKGNRLYLQYKDGGMTGILREFVQKHKTFMVVDESTTIKEYKSICTRVAIDIGHMCDYRWILNGTPVTQGMEDLWAQFMYLDPSIIGVDSFFLFKNRYCITGGYQGKMILGYQNEQELMDRIAPYIDQVKKAEVLPDLPPKLYQKIRVDLSPDQKRVIKQLESEFEAEDDGEILTTKTVLERMTRFQQVIGGHFPFDDNESDTRYSIKRISGTNPKLKALSELITGLPEETKVIIWARYVPEIELIFDLVSKMYPDQVVTFYGKNTDDERISNVHNFQRGKTRFIISNQAVGGMGQTWTAANTVIYFSNTFSYKDRLQSEDRAHRKGSEIHDKILYYDIEANSRYDKMILKAIERKSEVADFVSTEIQKRSTA